MNRLPKFLCLAGLAAALAAGAGSLQAQDAPEGGGRRDRQGGGPGGFDPEQMRQRMMERMREQFEVKDDEEWKLISGRIEKVNEARRNVGNRAGMGMMFGGRRGGPGGQGGPGGGPGGGRGGFGGEPNPDAEALQKVLESNGSADQIKAALAKYRKSVEANEAKLAKAQDELREVLTVKQEATAVLMGLLK